MITVTAPRETSGIDRFQGTHCVTFYTWNLHQSTYRITGQAKIMFHTDFCSICNLTWCTIHHCGQSSCCHGTCHTNFTLTAYFGCGKRSTLFVQNTNCACSEQKCYNFVFIKIFTESLTIVHYRRNNSCSTISWCGNNT